MSRAGRSSEAGFTLLEALVVLVVLSLAATVAGFALPGAGDRAKLTTAAAELEAVLVQARTLARKSATIRQVAFDLDERRYRLTGEAGWTLLPKGVELTIVSAHELGSPRRPAIAFLPDGTSSGAILTLLAGSHRAVRRVEWLTGRVRHERP
jgi:general secretion pathway protein H